MRAREDAWEALTEPVPDRGALGPLHDFVRFDGPVRHSPYLETFARQVPTPTDVSLSEQVRGVGVYVGESLRYEPEVTDWRSNTDDFLESGAGVCQDFAHLMLGLLRLRGIPCRYVSGYLHEEGRATAESHAWVEVYTQAQGWLGFDPTHRQPSGERHIVVATGRDYNDVPPNRGIYRGSAKEKLEARVTTRSVERRDVVELHEEIASIDLPVFRQLPTRQPGVDGPEKQTQQQQQQ
jgi:transglutaminase-like putative cysteine protease